MKPETVEIAKLMLLMLLEQGASYAEAGRPFGLARSTVERDVKALLRNLVANGGVDGLDEDGLTSFALVRKASREVLAAIEGFEPGSQQRFSNMLTEKDLEQADARLRRRSQNPSRDMALLAVLFQTGAKPVELARLQVRDCLTPGGAIRSNWHMRPESTINGLCRPVHLSSTVVRSALDLYLVDRVNRKLGMWVAGVYRGLDPCSALFLTTHGKGFEVRSRSMRDPRPTCPLMTATLRLAFRRAGWLGLTAQAVRRMVAARLSGEGAPIGTIAKLLGVSSERAAQLLTDPAMIELAAPRRSITVAASLDAGSFIHSDLSPAETVQLHAQQGG